MCIIVDADKTGELLKAPASGEARPLRDWLGRGGTLVYSTGGAFKHQFPEGIRRRIAKLFRNARLKNIPKEDVREKMKTLPPKGELRSDRKKGIGDRHILALALASRAEVLYTGDADLMDDFRDKEIMGNLRGKIYSGVKTRELLRPNLCKNC